MDHGYQSFGPFLIVRTLGRGGMGEVFIARTPWDEHPVAALKRLRPDVARVPTFAERFRHESQLAVRLEHENVVGTLDVGAVHNQLYVVSELVFGKDTGIIADRLRERGQGGPAAVAIRLMLDVLSGLAYVHEARDLDGTPLSLVHRDITPGNLLVGYDGIARLADFGLAKSLLTEEANLTQHGEILGTPNYLAPEIIRGEPASRASDLYGLGAVMYRFLTGVAPHHGPTAEVLMKVLSEEPKPLHELRPDLSPWIVTCVHALLTKSPAQRPADVRALIKQLGLEAKASGLLVPRAAVGQWLAGLFAQEMDDELEERDRLLSVDPTSVGLDGQGTVVLAARATSPAGFTAPASDTSKRAGFDDSDGIGHARTDAQPTPSAAGLGAVVPSDVTDASEVAAVIEMSALDGMPTQAVTIQPSFMAVGDESGTHETVSKPPEIVPRRTEVSDAETHFSPLRDDEEQEESPTALPGFVGAHGSIPAAYLPVDTSLEAENGASGRARPRSPGSVVVAPASSAPNARAVPELSAVGARFEPRLSPAERVSGALVPRPSRTAAPPAPGRTAVPPTGAGRNLLLLVSMLLVAVLLGVFVGALVVSYGNPVAVVAPRGPLYEQLFRVQTALVGRVERGEVVPADVWSKVTRAGAALEAGDEAAAAALLDELERMD